MTVPTSPVTNTDQDDPAWCDPEIVRRYLDRAHRKWTPPVRQATRAERRAIVRACLEQGVGTSGVCRAFRINGVYARQLIAAATTPHQRTEEIVDGGSQ